MINLSQTFRTITEADRVGCALDSSGHWSVSEDLVSRIDAEAIGHQTTSRPRSGLQKHSISDIALRDTQTDLEDALAV